MLEQVRELFEAARIAERKAENKLSETLPVGKVITFRKGNMLQNDNAEVQSVSGRRIKIKNLFSGAERWIDVSDVQGI